jgi:NAD(P)-dependent dehydrogenase (short-subunit alcohol dehydrogenase family)
MVLAVPTDITNEKDVQNLYMQTQQKFGRHADVLLNVAGYLGDEKPVGEQDIDAWWKPFVSKSQIKLRIKDFN